MTPEPDEIARGIVSRWWATLYPGGPRSMEIRAESLADLTTVITAALADERAKREQAYLKARDRANAVQQARDAAFARAEAAEATIALLRADMDRADCQYREGVGLRHCPIERLCWRCRAEAAEAKLADAERRNLVSFCCWCGLTQHHASLEERMLAMVEHTVDCDKRPELVLLDRIEALEEALRDIIASPAELDDARINYVTIQVSRADLDHARGLLTHDPSAHAPDDPSAP